MATVDEWLAEYSAKEHARLARSQAAYDARLKTTRASFVSACGQCRQSIAIGDVLVRPGGRRFANFWYCYWCGQIAHECDRPRRGAE